WRACNLREASSRLSMGRTSSDQPIERLDRPAGSARRAWMTQQPFAGDTPPASHPGKMTAVMRATPRVQGPKVLRIGLVQGGRVLEERVMKQRAHVTVGPS